LENDFLKTKRWVAGFSLVEILIVIVILGIIAGIGMQQYRNVSDRAKIAVAQADHQLIVSSVNLYIFKAQVLPKYPSDLDEFIEGGWSNIKDTPIVKAHSFAKKGGAVTITTRLSDIRGDEENLETTIAPNL